MSAGFCLVENGKNGPHQLSCSLLAQLHRHACRSSLRLVHKINIESVLKRRVERMVKGNNCLLQLEPSSRPLAAAFDVHFFHDHGAHKISSPNMSLRAERSNLLFSTKTEYLKI